ncbi:ZIP zinc transporter [Ordospora pajunii]|uniref:ZIP zinc transporter n=1 Tax=Ordospora pajunii TaxID=3039483 RepID=UPI0029526906|nr:ZIP zinc transporter [Ordospora pajunii]KAH9410808.1 ZIP zinc transporter [Ordospora pajunii]
MNINSMVFASIVFLISLVICISPRAISSGSFKKVFPFLTLLTAGFMLGVQLLELSPHMASSCDGPKEHHDHGEGSTSPDTDIGHEHTHGHDDNQSIFAFFTAGLSFILLLAIDSIVLKHDHCEGSEIAHSHQCHGVEHEHDRSEDANKTAEEMKCEESLKREEKKAQSENMGCCDTNAIKNASSKAQVFIFILGISIHSFFEGLAFNSIERIGSLEIGLLFHKMLESFALGVPLFTSGMGFFSGLMLAVFYSALTPIGIMLGSAPGYLNQPIIKSVFRGLALGSIMFMVSIEMIPPMFNHPKVNRVHALLVLLSGYLLSSMMIYHSHSH